MALDTASNFGNSSINSAELKLYFEEELRAILRDMFFESRVDVFTSWRDTMSDF